MSLFRRSLLDVDSLVVPEIQQIFSFASQFLLGRRPPELQPPPVVALLFFEPSTRTRMSFEMAALRLGMATLSLDGASGSSLVKGETLKDTLENVLAMGPDAIVLRYGEDAELSEFLPQASVPILLAGQGKRSHPTQALLDAFTIEQKLGQVQGQRVLIVGDVTHSRVAHSNISLLRKLGADVGVCGPQDWLGLEAPFAAGVRHFSTLSEGLSWASVCMALRIQLERMSPQAKIDQAQYREQFGLTQKSLSVFSKTGIILHPGPINRGVEMDDDVSLDSRCCVLTQVQNGVAIRAALLAHCLGLKGL